MQNSGEPSVEEILESIKRVIAREANPDGVAPPARTARDAAPDAERVEPAAPEEAEEVLELDEETMLALSEHEDDADRRYAEAQDDASAAAPLTGAATESAMRDNFAALAMPAQPARSPQIVRSGETSLEGMVRDMLRPMLAQWLDDNLPTMVEELVKAEIARIAGKQGR